MECILPSIYIEDCDSIKGSSAICISGRLPELAAGTEDLDKSLASLSRLQNLHQTGSWCSNYYFLRGAQCLDWFTAWQWTYCFTSWSFRSPLVSLVCSFLSTSVNWFEIHRWGRLYNCNCLDLMSICSENWLTEMCTSVHTHMYIQTLPSLLHPNRCRYGSLKNPKSSSTFELLLKNWWNVNKNPFFKVL